METSRPLSRNKHCKRVFSLINVVMRDQFSHNNALTCSASVTVGARRDFVWASLFLELTYLQDVKMSDVSRTSSHSSVRVFSISCLTVYQVLVPGTVCSHFSCASRRSTMSSPPPWRPRLVHEGTPLYAGGNVDQSMQEAEAVARSPQHHHHAHVHHLHHHAVDSSQHNASPGMSSLAKAAGEAIHIRSTHISKRLVIENDSDEIIHEKGSDEMAYSPTASVSSAHSMSRKKASPLKTRLVIGKEDEDHHHKLHQSHPDHFADNTQYYHDVSVERMVGVDYFGTKGPLVVMDGANIAYAYADAIAGFRGNIEPDARGIQIAANYFLSVDVRVLVVIPAPWFRAKPRDGDAAQGNALMMTPQLEVLRDLKSRGLLVAAPPRDDDDAYALTIARREDTRTHNRGGGGFVLSCDMFRDAVYRDATGDLQEWLTKGSGSGPGRISFAFCDMGSTDDYGDRQMDFVPNPRHPLISWIEGEHRKKAYKI